MSVCFNSRLLAADYANTHGMTVRELPDGTFECVPVPPAPPADRTDFDNACSLFRSVCAQIGAMLGVEDFRGGFEEMTAFQQSESFRTLEGLHIAIEWSAANELCKYEGAKIGLGQPQWWHECWKVSVTR